jgi:tetratricopeptide (TPR) repeat protein
MKHPISYKPQSHRRRGILLLFIPIGASLLAYTPLGSSFISDLAGIGAQAAYAQQSQAENDPALKQMLSIAESEHEMIKLLIRQGQFQRVLPEMKRILALDLPIKYEGAVAQSASLISEMLVEKSQFAIAHELIGESLIKMRLNENKAALWKIQAYVFKSEGNLDQALECLQKAIDLEKGKN